MIRNVIFSIVFVAFAIVSLSLSRTAVGQGESKPSTSNSVEKEIPRAALLTERGMQLADRLRQLRRTEANMGPAHPLLPEIQNEIVEVKDQLAAWSPANNPKLAEQIPQMNDEDLRQLVLRMSTRIKNLENRVHKLERQREIF